MTTRFTNDEMNLMSIYNPGSRAGLIAELAHMLPFLSKEETELRTLTEGTLKKLSDMSDTEFETLELIPDY